MYDPPLIEWYARPLFYDLWKRFRFRSDILAEEAGVEEDVILSMFHNTWVKRSTAETVLSALSRLTGWEYTLNTVRIQVDPEEMRNGR
jgi:hypothetical protein